MTTTPPDDASSLLVPIFLDAYVWASSNQSGYAWYTANYNELLAFNSPLPAAFTPPGVTPPTGVYLHWALPDALTHGHAPPAGGAIEFPHVPNRWLIARFNTPQNEPWQCKLWVVQSDYSNSDGTSAYLDPFNASNLQVAADQETVFNIQNAQLGKNYTIDAWEALSEPGGPLFLKAVGPANVSFAAYVPFVQDVFSFVDQPPDGTFTYMVVGWYSDPGSGDPLRGVTTFDPNVWDSQDDWLGQSAAQRFQTLLQYLQWSVQDNDGSSTPSTSLYHGLVVDVEWPPGNTLPVNGGIDQSNVAVAVGNTGVDALAALIQAQAKLQAKQDPSDANAWLAAGNTLAELVQAAIYDLLDDYAVPGGAAMIREQIQRAWFGSDPGGVVWSAVSTVPQAAGQPASSPNLTPGQSAALDQQLAALNQGQRDLDAAQRQLTSLQGQYYLLWLKVGIANSDNPPPLYTVPPWDTLQANLIDPVYPDFANKVWAQLSLMNQAQALLPGATDSDVATAWANQYWSFPDPKGGTLTLSELGLALKASVMPNFWHPNDPVVMIAGLKRSQKHGADGRYNSDGTLTCRLPGQTITGLQIPGQPTLDVATLQAGGVTLDPYSGYASIPSIPTLVHEAFLADPQNAGLMAGAIQGNATAIGNAITGRINQEPGARAWIGTAPSPFAIRPWQQAWAPLFLEWQVQYYPTGSGSGQERTYATTNWQFDGERYKWAGTGYDPNYSIEYNGRALLTAQAPMLFKRKIDQYLANNSSISSQQLEALLAIVGDWDLLSQSLSGLLDQLITLVPQELLPPPRPQGPEAVQSPHRGPGASRPSDWTLIGGQFQQMPLLQGQGQDANFFYPIRGGFLAFEQLQVVDAFGQTCVFHFEQGFEPILGSDLTPSHPMLAGPPNGTMQLTPRLIQSARLDLDFLANDGSGGDTTTSGKPNAICGWLLPNHLDGAIAVYDADGVALGELVAQPAPDNWRPRPGAPGDNPPPQTPAGIANKVLRDVIVSFAAQTADVFGDLLQVIDETLWMVDPLGGRKDQFLSVLIGRPLAVVQVSLQLELRGDPAYSQLWNSTLDPNTPTNLLRDTGGVENIPFPVRLGSLELRDDGVIGYLLPAEGYATFHAVHYPDERSSDDSFIRRIIGPQGQYQGNISLQCQGPSVTATLIIDPRGSIHAYTGILPVLSAQLPPHAVETFMKQLQVTFQTGPVIADPGTLRIPQPAESHGVWSWIQRATPTDWESDSIVDADDKARLPDAGLQLREGWLQLSGIGE
jgi:hypothetical protein